MTDTNKTPTTKQMAIKAASKEDGDKGTGDKKAVDKKEADKKKADKKKADNKKTDKKEDKIPDVEVTAGWAMDDAHQGERMGARMADRSKAPRWLKDFFMRHSNVLYRIVLTVSVILPLAPSISLLAFIVPGRTFGGPLVSWVEYYRSNVQVVVSILVSTLTYLNVLIISKLLLEVGIQFKDNFVFKFLLSNVGLKEDNKTKSSDKDDTKEMKAWFEFFTGGKWTWKDFWIGVSCFTLLYLPHLVWVGALTPNIVSVSVGTDNAPLIPQYSQQSASNWANNNKTSGAECFADFTKKPQNFTGCAASYVAYNVLQNMGVASAISDPEGFYPHEKADNTSYVYYGRSFGVGSAAGVQPVWTSSTLGQADGRTYTEPGYWTDVHCFRNKTSAFKLQKSPASASSGVNIFKPTGRLPNDPIDVTSYSVIAKSEVSDAVAWATSSSGNEHVLAIAVAGDTYAELDNIQCAISFSSATYSVLENYTASSITVQKVQTSGSFNPTLLANTAIFQLGKISQFQSSPFTSELGDNLQQNAAIHALDNTESLAEEIDYLDGVADAVTVALDDILAYVGASQFAQTTGPGSTMISYQPIYQRVQLGTEQWIAVAMCLTGILFILGVSRAVFRSYMKQHPKTLSGEPEGKATDELEHAARSASNNDSRV